MDRYNDQEFMNLIKPVIANLEFQKTQHKIHHGITRFDHCLRVAYYSYKVTKAMGLDYREVAIAAMLHDFFIDEVDKENGIARLRKHPTYALKNAKKYFDLTEKQEDIIKTHMFPVTFTPPKYLESWIVNSVDDVAAIYERTCSLKNELQAATTFLFIIFINFIKYR